MFAGGVAVGSGRLQKPGRTGALTLLDAGPAESTEGQQSPLRVRLKGATSYAQGREIVQPKGSRAVIDQQGALRLHGEVEKLAQRNAWSGVMAKHQSLLELKGVQITADHYHLAAQAYGPRGEPQDQLDCLQTALALERTSTDLQQAITHIQSH
jgi:hypothetical protein